MNSLCLPLLVVCLAGCRSGTRAAPPPLGPGSRVVIPDLAQPKAPEPKVDLAVSPRPESVAPTAPTTTSASPLDPVATDFKEDLAHATTSSPVVATDPDRPSELPADIDGGAASQEPVSPKAPLNAAETAPDPASLLQGEAALHAAAAKALAENRYDDLHEISRQLAALPSLEHARVLTRDGEFKEALAVLEQALVPNPDQPDLLEATGFARLKLAEAGARDLYPAALDAFQRAGATPTALLGQSRAAYALGEFDQALDCARRAIVLLSVQPDRRLEISPAAEIVLADAGLEVLHRLLANPGPASSALFDDIARALQWRIERVRTDAAAHGRLVALYLEVGKVIQAESAAQDGLNSSPGDAELTKQLARAAFSIGGPDRLLEAFEHFRKKFPLQPLGYWYPALEFFKSSVAHQTLTLFESSDKSPVNRAKQRKRAKSYFAQVRVLDPRYAASCLEYEALCVALDGWEAFDAREYEKARGAFKSMDNVLPGSVALDPASVDAQWSGQLASGASGLDKIAVLYREAKNLSASAAVYGDLADLLPNDAHWVREAAESAKLAAESLAEEAAACERASLGQVNDPTRLKALRKLAHVREKEQGNQGERNRFAAVAIALKQSSDEHFEQSWERYQDAVRLTPLDVQLACDAARVAIYHTQRELDLAEALLAGAIRLAREQIQNPGLEPSAVDPLKHVLAGALQDQGKLELDFKDNPDAAVLLLNEALLVDPDRMPFVREHLLPQAIEASNTKKMAGGALSSPPAENPGPKKQS